MKLDCWGCSITVPELKLFVMDELENGLFGLELRFTLVDDDTGTLALDVTFVPELKLP